MRESRISLLLLISLSLLLISFLALGIWGYQFYNRVDKIVMKPVIKKTEAINQDSLLKIYTATIKDLEKKLGATYDNAGALEDTLNLNLTDYYKLKSEVSGMLTNPKSDEDFSSAKEKITELQIAMESLRKTNANVTEENKKLYQILANMKNTAQVNENKAVTVSAPKSFIPKKKVPAKFVSNTLPEDQPGKYKAVEKPAVQAPVTVSTKPVSEISVMDLDLQKSKDKNDNNLEIVGSFEVKSELQNNNTNDLMIIVTQPDGKVIQKSNWESGSFNTNDGKKIYSYKVRIDGSNKNPRKIKFSLPVTKDLPGNYSIQVYHNGEKIGSSKKGI